MNCQLQSNQKRTLHPWSSPQVIKYKKHSRNYIGYWRDFSQLEISSLLVFCTLELIWFSLAQTKEIAIQTALVSGEVGIISSISEAWWLCLLVSFYDLWASILFTIPLPWIYEVGEGCGWRLKLPHHSLSSYFFKTCIGSHMKSHKPPTSFF